MSRPTGFILSQTLADDKDDPMALMYMESHPNVDPTTKVRYVRVEDAEEGWGATGNREEAQVFPTRQLASAAAARIIQDELEKLGAHATWRIEEQPAVAKAA